jgi:hypothetical protein
VENYSTAPKERYIIIVENLINANKKWFSALILLKMAKTN